MNKQTDNMNLFCFLCSTSSEFKNLVNNERDYNIAKKRKSGLLNCNPITEVEFKENAEEHGKVLADLKNYANELLRMNPSIKKSRFERDARFVLIRIINIIKYNKPATSNGLRILKPADQVPEFAEFCKELAIIVNNIIDTTTTTPLIHFQLKRKLILLIEKIEKYHEGSEYKGIIMKIVKFYDLVLWKKIQAAMKKKEKQEEADKIQEKQEEADKIQEKQEEEEIQESVGGRRRRRKSRRKSRKSRRKSRKTKRKRRKSRKTKKRRRRRR
tara:strand:+ start:603 stop:1415 length:813 start_codon:yes stop_codon:yes gene_type:complete